jgi:CubicO group peptidase (beta-lactamase class C family)
MIPLQSVLVGLAAIAVSVHYTGIWTITTRSTPSGDVEKYSCRPFLPKLFIETPPAPDHPLVKDASRRLAEYFSKRFAKGDIDSLSVAVVTSGGALFEENYGVIRGNETATSPPTTSHSQYRIASVSKLFAVMEGLILEQRGALSWLVSLFPI